MTRRKAGANIPPPGVLAAMGSSLGMTRAETDVSSLISAARRNDR
jgi:hypothetical protein